MDHLVKFFTFQCVLKEIFAWSMGLTVHKDVLKSVIIMCGVLYVMMPGTIMMLQLCVDSWDSLYLVCIPTNAYGVLKPFVVAK